MTFRIIEGGRPGPQTTFKLRGTKPKRTRKPRATVPPVDTTIPARRLRRAPDVPRALPDEALQEAVARISSAAALCPEVVSGLARGLLADGVRAHRIADSLVAAAVARGMQHDEALDAIERAILVVDLFRRAGLEWR